MQMELNIRLQKRTLFDFQEGKFASAIMQKTCYKTFQQQQKFKKNA